MLLGSTNSTGLKSLKMVAPNVKNESTTTASQLAVGWNIRLDEAAARRKPGR